jgi:hypothetical protein
MRRKQLLSIAVVALLALALLSATACKSSGMAVTTGGQVLYLAFDHPTDLPEAGVDNLDVNIGMGSTTSRTSCSSRASPQLVVLDQTNDRGVNVMHSPGSNLYRSRSATSRR